jgi:putative salt-induced outer membrane protein
MKGLIAVPVSLLACASAFAGEFSGEAAFGFLETEGNAHSKSLNGKADVVWTQSPWRDTLSLAAVNSSGGDVGAELYSVGDKLDYDFTPRDYFFGEAVFEKDLTGAVRQRTTETAGYGRHVLIGPTHFLDLEIGAGLRQETENVTFEHKSDPIARLSGKYQWKISDQTSFIQTAKTETGQDNTFTEAVSELHMPVAGALSAVLSYTLRNNSTVPAGVHHTDTSASAALAYKFGGDGG